MISSKPEHLPTSTSAEAAADDVRGQPHSAVSRGWLLLPREHGAWGMVSLPFLAAAAIAPGTVFTIRTAAASLAVFSTFLLRDPVVILRRIHSDPSRLGTTNQKLMAKRSLCACLGGLAISGTILLITLPPFWVLLLGAGGLALVIGSVAIAVERSQREITSQMLGVLGLTGSCLPAYLAVRGDLDWLGPAIWAFSAAHSLASVLVVRARLETILSRRRAAAGSPSGRFFGRAVGWQVGLWTAIVSLALLGYQWLALPFLFPGTLHGWELWQLRSGNEVRISMHRLGWIQLAASVLFYSLLVLAFRGHFIP